MSTSPDDKCAKCGKPRTTGLPTITQWITACSCSLVVETEIEICKTCGKRIEKARAGSLTQWILRSDTCSCKSGLQVATTPAAIEQTKDDVVPVPEVELSVDEKYFPIDRYKPLEELGKGAAGVVYMCRDRLLKKRVAVKCLHVLTAEQLVSFQTEAKATSSLNHPNIIKVFDFGATTSGVPFMVMEYFHGTSLETILNTDGPLSPRLVRFIFDKIMDALEYAHEQGVFHRDIKPSNILFDRETMDVRLIDFGVALAKQANQEPTIVQGTTIAGTPRYMSPDQIQGRAYSKSSEIYSLGCVMFECLTGDPPFNGETALEILGRHASEQPPSITDLLPLSSELEHLDPIIMRSLEKEPDRRFKSMTRFRAALNDFENDNAITPQEPSRKSGLSRGISIALGSLILLMLISLAGFSFFQQTPRKSEKAKRAKPRRIIVEELFQPTDPRTVEAWKNIEPLDSNLITDESLRCFVGRHDFESVDLKSTIIRGKGLKYLQNCSIKTLDLTFTNLNDEGYKQLAKLKGLKQLIVSNTDITDDQLEILSVLPLQALHLGSCKNIKHGFVLANMRTLQFLMVSNTSVDPEVLNACTNLRHLNLDSMDLTDNDIVKLYKLKKLEHLILHAPRTTSASLKFIARNFSALRELKVYQTKMDPMDATCLLPLHLDILTFRGKPIDEQALKVFGRMKQLKELNLYQVKATDIKELTGLNELRIFTLTSAANSKRISETSLANFRKAHPRCKLTYTDPQEPRIKDEDMKLLEDIE